MLLTGLLLLLWLGISSAVDTHLVIAESICQRPLAQNLPVATEPALAAAPQVAEVFETALPGLTVSVNHPSLLADADIDDTPAFIQWLVGARVTDRVLAVGPARDRVYTAAAARVVMGHHVLADTHDGWLGV